MKLRLLQWNVLYTEPLDKIVTVIKELDPDVACLQELEQRAGHDAGKMIAAALGYHAHYSYDPFVFSDGTTGQLGNGIFSKQPLAAKRTVNILSYKIGDQAVGYDYIEAKIVVGSSDLTIATIHPPFRPSFYTNKAQKAMLSKLLPEIEATPANYVLTGDFNATPGTAVTREVKKRLKHAGPTYAQPSWTKFDQTIAGHPFNGMNWRLDYVFYKGKLKVSSSQIVDVKSSDHAPVLVEFGVDDSLRLDE